MKVLFVTRGFPTEKDVMDGNYEAIQAKAIASSGNHVAVITIREKSFRYFFDLWKLSQRIVDGVFVYEGVYPSLSIRFVRRVNKYLRKFAYKRAYEKYISEHGKPDVVHAHIISTASFAIFYKKDYHLPFVITEHWTKTNVSEIPRWLIQMSYAYHQADQVICVSQALADSLKRNFQVESMVINNMVDNRFFQSSKIDRHDGQFKFIAVGAFRKNKGFDVLVEAFASAQFPPNVTLDIVGDGEERIFVEKKIQQYNLYHQIRLLGTKPPEEVNDLLCHSDCFVLSSRLETFAIVVIEAMAKGLPVIATKSGGPETFLLPEHGLLVEKENVKELSDAMVHMKEHHGDYDSRQIREFCYNHFSQDVIATQIINVYKRVISGRN